MSDTNYSMNNGQEIQGWTLKEEWVMPLSTYPPNKRTPLVATHSPANLVLEVSCDPHTPFFPQFDKVQNPSLFGRQGSRSHTQHTLLQSCLAALIYSRSGLLFSLVILDGHPTSKNLAQKLTVFFIHVKVQKKKEI